MAQQSHEGPGAAYVDVANPTCKANCRGRKGFLSKTAHMEPGCSRKNCPVKRQGEMPRKTMVRRLKNGRPQWISASQLRGMEHERSEKVANRCAELTAEQN